MFTPAQPWHRDRSLPLDMLRGVAILLVLGRHDVMGPTDLGPLTSLAYAWRTIGWSGVDLFFVLSGYLVSGLFFSEYRKSGHINVSRFVIRRGFKIWPPYLAYLAVVGLWLTWRHHLSSPTRVWEDLWPNFLHVQNYFHTPRIHTWSLAVEEHFYLGLALLFMVLIRTCGIAGFLRWLPVLIGGGVLAAATARHIAYLVEGPDRMNLYATHLRFDGLLIGTLIAYWTHFHGEKMAALLHHPIGLIIIGAGLAAPTLILSPEASPWLASLGLVGVYIGFGLIMLGGLQLPKTHAWSEKLLTTRPAAWLGQVGFYSYSIYLWHVDLVQTPIRKTLQLITTPHLSAGAVWVIATIVYVVAAILCGAALAHLVERPSLRIRDRLFPSLAQGAPIMATQPTAGSLTPAV